MAQHAHDMINWLYDFLLWLLSVLVDLFFREIHPRSSWKIPRSGPIIFVIAPHANQFVDPLIIMRMVRVEARRRISFLIAEKSMRRRFIGAIARGIGAVPVSRAQDLKKSGKGKVYLPSPDDYPTLLRGVGTDFESSEYTVGGLIILPTVDGKTPQAEIAEIKGPEELILKKEFKEQGAVKLLTKKGADEGTRFSVAPKVDQTEVYDEVFKRLNIGGCIGIFPEGGSHDRTELLPLKAGVAIMALGALAANPDCGLKVVPCGLNYFHAHKFRSRAVVEFGSPVEVPPELVELYRGGERREAVKQLLDTIYQSLVAVTQTSPDYDTLMLIQAVRRLYKPSHKKLPLPMVVELNRRLVKGYSKYKDDPRLITLKEDVLRYNKRLRQLGLRDHQVDYVQYSNPAVVLTFVSRVLKLALLLVGALPGAILFAPVFIAGKIISLAKAKEALASSTVKVQARDVVATWKLLVALLLAPILYAIYITIFTVWTARTRINGYVPEWIPLWAIGIAGWIIFPAITFAALRIGEVGMDIFKSLRPLILSLDPSSTTALHNLRETRSNLSADVTELINILGPEVFPDFESTRIIADPFKSESQSISTPNLHSTKHNRNDSDLSSTALSPPEIVTPSSVATRSTLPPNEAFHSLANIGLFSSHPGSRSRSRSRSHSRSSSTGGLSGSSGFPIQAFSTVSGKEDLDEVSRRIRGAMRERGMERHEKRRSRSSAGEDEWELPSGPPSPVEGKKAV